MKCAKTFTFVFARLEFSKTKSVCFLLIGNLQKRNILVAEGAVAEDGMLAGMNLYVKGVEGDIPQ